MNDQPYRTLLATILAFGGTAPLYAQATETTRIAWYPMQTTMPPELAAWASQVLRGTLSHADPIRFEVVEFRRLERLLPVLQRRIDGEPVRKPLHALAHQKACLSALSLGDEREAGIPLLLTGELHALFYHYMFVARTIDTRTGEIVQQHEILVDGTDIGSRAEKAAILAQRFATRLGLTPAAAQPADRAYRLPDSLIPAPEALRDDVTGLPREVINRVDGSVLVLVPPGFARIGRDGPWDGTSDVRDSEPAHRVWLPAYYIGKYEVTNAQFERFRTQTDHPDRPRAWAQLADAVNQPQQPAGGISYADAMAYVQWAGLILPTEEMWEKAALGGEQLRQNGDYPWGDRDPDPRFAVLNLNVPTEPLPPVTALPRGAGPYQTLGMAGSVSEWCFGHLRPYSGFSELYPVLSLDDPHRAMVLNGRIFSPTAGRVARGGSWQSSRGGDLKSWRRQSLGPGAAARVGDNFSTPSTGFRVAQLALFDD